MSVATQAAASEPDIVFELTENYEDGLHWIERGGEEGDAFPEWITATVQLTREKVSEACSLMRMAAEAAPQFGRGVEIRIVDNEIAWAFKVTSDEAFTGEYDRFIITAYYGRVTAQWRVEDEFSNAFFQTPELDLFQMAALINGPQPKEHLP